MSYSVSSSSSSGFAVSSSSSISAYAAYASSSSYIPSATAINASELIHVPLTTIFTPPSRCTQIPYTFSAQASGLSTFWRNSNGPGEGANAACYPSFFRYMNRTNVNAEYSPGVCPHGYSAASSATNPSNSAWTSWCCPSGMSYAQDYGCYTTITTPTVVNLDAVRTTSIVTPFVAADWYVQVAWAPTDLKSFTPAAAPLLGSAPATTSAASGPSDGMEYSALSVGIPVGLVTTAVIAVACYALWRRKRRRTREASLLESTAEEEKDWNAEMDYQRYDSAQVHTSSSDDTPTTHHTDNSPIFLDRSNVYRAAPQDPQDSWTAPQDPQDNWAAPRDNWRDSIQFDETQPVTEPR